MKGNEIVWRTLADHALQGSRRWDSIADLAFKAGVPQSTTHLAVQKPTEIGAVRAHRSGGFSVISPDKLLTLVCAWRNLARDTVTRTNRDGLHRVLNTVGGTSVLGGAEAAVHHLGGTNTVADYSTHIVYTTGPELYGSLPRGDEVIVLKLDTRAAKDWFRYTSLAQTYADLFAMPGWQASEFRLALRDRFIRDRDWDHGIN